MDVADAAVARRARVGTAGAFARGLASAAVAAALSSTAAIGAESEGSAPAATGGESESAFARPATVGRPALQMSSDFGAPTLAISSYRPVGDIESRGVRVAPFTVRAAAIAGVGYDDNVAYSQNNRISSPFQSLNPSVSVGLEGATQQYSVVYRGNYGRFSNSSRDNYDDHNISLAAANSWNTRLRSLLQYDFLKGHNARGSTATPTTTMQEWRWQSLKASAQYGAEGAQGALEGLLGFNSRKYTTDRVITAGQDYDQFIAGGQFTYRLAPKTKALVQVARGDISHPSDATLDSTEMRYLVGVTWEALAKTRGQAKLGYTTKDFSDPARADFSGPSYEIGATWLPRTYSTVDVLARRSLQETPEIGSYFVVATVATATWNHEWSERTRSSLLYAFTRQDLRGLNRVDNYNEVAVRVSYALRRWVRIGAEFRHDTRDSDLPGFEFKRNLSLLLLETTL